MDDAIEPEFMDQNAPPPATASEGQAKGVKVPRMEEREADLMRIGRDFGGRLHKLLEKYIAALAAIEAERDEAKANRCEDCGSNKIVRDCVRCGAPNCCAMCCTITTLTAARDSALKSLAERDEEISALKHEIKIQARTGGPSNV